MSSRSPQVNCLARVGASRVLTSPTTRGPISFTAIISAKRFISATSVRCMGILPESDRPSPEKSAEPVVTVAAANITEAEFHQLADEYLETVLSKFEELQDAREDVDVEFSAGVLTVNFGPEVGTYVINKQPPNKQIWLSSPKSGPKRFDWVILGDGQNEKQGTAVGDWIYLRDGSTLNKLFHAELGIDLGLPARRFGD